MSTRSASTSSGWAPAYGGLAQLRKCGTVGVVFWADPDAATGCVSLQCEDGSERTFVAADRLAPAVDPDAPPGLPDELAAAKRKLAAASYGAAGQDPRNLFSLYDRDNS